MMTLVESHVEIQLAQRRLAATPRPAGVCGSLDNLGRENYLFLMFHLFIVTEGEDVIENQII